MPKKEKKPLFVLSKGSSFFQAVEKGDVKGVKELFAKNELNILQGLGMDTPLTIACYNGHIDVVRVLLGDPKVDINMKNSDFAFPLYYASVRGFDDIVLLLLEKKELDVNQTTNGKETALCAASYAGRAGVIQVLVDDPRIDLETTINDIQNMNQKCLATIISKSPNGIRTPFLVKICRLGNYDHSFDEQMRHLDTNINFEYKNCSMLKIACDSGNGGAVAAILSHPALVFPEDSKDAIMTNLKIEKRQNVIDALVADDRFELDKLLEILQEALADPNISQDQKISYAYSLYKRRGVSPGEHIVDDSILSKVMERCTKDAPAKHTKAATQ